MGDVERRVIEDRESWLKWREEDMTASTGACLFGADVHPYTSAYREWALKSGIMRQTPMNPRLARRGHYVEKIAPEILQEEEPTWQIERCPYYYRIADERIGATPDLWGQRPDIEGTGVIDVKSVGPSTLQRWRDRDSGHTELPVHYAIQVNIQAGMTGSSWGAVAAITIGDGGLDCEMLDVPILPGLYKNFRELAKDFWQRVENKEPYPIDWGRDAETILDMYRDDTGGVVDLSEDEDLLRLLDQRLDYKLTEQLAAQAEKARKIVDAQIINKLGNAAAGRCGSALIKAPTVRVKEAVRKAYSFRRITITGYEASEDRAFVSDGSEG